MTKKIDQNKLDNLNRQIMMHQSKGYYVLTKDENTYRAVIEKERYEFMSFLTYSSSFFLSYHMSEQKIWVYNLLDLFQRVILFIPNIVYYCHAKKKQITVYGGENEG